MALYTKSIQKPVSKKDGLRICIMRRPGEDMDWDMWLPKLAPSNELLDAYKYQGLSWDEFKKKYQKQVITKQKKLLRIIADLSLNNNVTLLCWEEEADHCHRSLVEKECRKLLKN